MKKSASLWIFVCLASSVAVAGEIKTRVITTSTGTFTLDIPDHHYLRIYNFTQENNGAVTQRGVVIAGAATPTPSPSSTPMPTPSLTPSPTPTPTGTDLTATKTDDVGGRVFFPNSWDWNIHVANGGGTAAIFPSGTTVLSDKLPKNVVYSPNSPSVMNADMVNGTVSCTIVGSDLTCVASSGVTIGPGGFFDVLFSAMPAAPATYANPRITDGCSVDPNNVVSESSDANNFCSDTVVSAPTPTPTPAPRAVLTAAVMDPAPAATPEFIKQAVVDGPAQIHVDPVTDAKLVLSYQRVLEPTPTPTPTPIVVVITPTPTPTP